MNTCENGFRFFKVTGELCKDKYAITIAPWKLLIETPRYFEIKPENGGPVKRIFKEKMNTTIIETKQYANGMLSCSAFCTEDRIEEIQKTVLERLQESVMAYMADLQLNQLAINRHSSSF